MADKKKKPRKKATGYKMPAPLPLGEIIEDSVWKNKWRLGPSIGIGGFGEIYSACDDKISPPKGSSYPYVIKVEPHENGPLFVEKTFYLRNAGRSDVEKYMKAKNLSSLGMPIYYGSGSHEHKGEKYRFLVMERYGKDLWTIFVESGRVFPPATVFLIGIQMLDVLEYIHSRGYVHGDIKGANILLGIKNKNQTYLVDFGIASRLNDKEFKPDPKSAHNGTIEYTSRDAHLGVPTMRGDLEILAYNMLQWLTNKLPWDDHLNNPSKVQDLKNAFWQNLQTNIRKNYKNVPDPLIKFFEYINSMGPKDLPDYNKCRKLFESYLQSASMNRNSKLQFTVNKTSNKRIVEKDEQSDTVDGEEIVNKKKSRQKVPNLMKRGRKPKITDNLENCPQNDTEEEDDYEIKAKNNIKKNKLLKDKLPKIVRNVNGKRNIKSTVNDKTDSDNDINLDNSVEVVPVFPRNSAKRSSSEALVKVKLKKSKMTPEISTPVTKEVISVSTQTSTEKLRRSSRLEQSVRSANSSGDIFEDSFVIEKTPKKLLSKKEVFVERVVKKKVTTNLKCKS